MEGPPKILANKVADDEKRYIAELERMIRVSNQDETPAEHELCDNGCGRYMDLLKSECLVCEGYLLHYCVVCDDDTERCNTCGDRVCDKCKPLKKCRCTQYK